MQVGRDSDIVASPNSTEMPNISRYPKRQPTPEAIQAVLDRYEALMHRLIENHAPDFTDVGITMAQAKVLYVVMGSARRRPAASPTALSNSACWFVTPPPTTVDRWS